MAKKIVKNILLAFVITYSILNLIAFGIVEIERRNMLHEIVVEMQPENRTMELYIELEQSAERQIESSKEVFNSEETNVPVPATHLAMVQMYMMGTGHILEIQIFILICSISLSIVIGIIITLTEKSKVKEILYFVLIGIIIDLIYTLYFHLTRNLPDAKFFEGFIENFIYNIEMYGLYYIIIYAVAFITRYFINKNKANKLNEELKNKQK